jgi:hypothetical protein
MKSASNFSSGGLGLVGGIADVGCLCDALDGMNKGLTDDSILDEYSRIRREKYETIVDPMSTANFKRLWEKEPEDTFAEDEFFKLIEKANKDENLMNQLREVCLSLELLLYVIAANLIPGFYEFGS